MYEFKTHEFTSSATLHSDSEHWLSQDSESFFRFYKIPLGSTLTGHEKCHNFHHPGAHTQIHTLLDKNCRDTSHAFLEYLQWNFSDLEKDLESGFWHIFTVSQNSTLVSNLTGMRSAATFHTQKPTHISTQHRANKVESLCMFFQSTYKKWNFADLKKMSESSGSEDCSTFFRSANFHLEMLSKAKRSGTTFPA